MMDLKLSARQMTEVKNALHDLHRAKQLVEIMAEGGEDVDERLLKAEHLTRSLETLKKHFPARGDG